MDGLQDGKIFDFISRTTPTSGQALSYLTPLFKLLSLDYSPVSSDFLFRHTEILRQVGRSPSARARCLRSLQTLFYRERACDD